MIDWNQRHEAIEKAAGDVVRMWRLDGRVDDKWLIRLAYAYDLMHGDGPQELTLQEARDLAIRVGRDAESRSNEDREDEAKRFEDTPKDPTLAERVDRLERAVEALAQYAGWKLQNQIAEILNGPEVGKASAQ